MKLYTKRGDQGMTDLFGGQRVGKDDLRVEAYGTVDELNSVLGLARSGCEDRTLSGLLDDLQHRLFELGADLATPRPSTEASKRDRAADSAVPRIGAQQIAALERHIDSLCADLPEMRYFVLPGGTELSARLHLARTVCRRAERAVVRLAKSESAGVGEDSVVVFLNRLSDLLFAMARKANHAAGVADVPWVAAGR